MAKNTVTSTVRTLQQNMQKINNHIPYSAIKKVKSDAVWCFCLPSGMSWVTRLTRPTMGTFTWLQKFITKQIASLSFVNINMHKVAFVQHFTDTKSDQKQNFTYICFSLTHTTFKGDLSYNATFKKNSRVKQHIVYCP
jgi:hypothetical protein